MYVGISALFLPIIEVCEPGVEVAKFKDDDIVIRMESHC